MTLRQSYSVSACILNVASSASALSQLLPFSLDVSFGMNFQEDSPLLLWGCVGAALSLCVRCFGQHFPAFFVGRFGVGRSL